MKSPNWIDWALLSQLVKLGYISPRTFSRWRKTRQIPALARAWSELLDTGNLGRLSAAWNGWSLYKDKLTSPDGWTFAPAEIAGIPFRHSQIAALECELRILQVENATLKAGAGTQQVFSRRARSPSLRGAGRRTAS